MERVFLCNYTEFGAMDKPSMRDFFEERPYQGKKKIVAFLQTQGQVGAVAAGRAMDCFTGERIPGELSIRTYDRFSWCSDLSYYVEKYNLRLPREFEEMVLHQNRE